MLAVVTLAVGSSRGYFRRKLPRVDPRGAAYRVRVREYAETLVAPAERLVDIKGYVYAVVPGYSLISSRLVGKGGYPVPPGGYLRHPVRG